MNFLRGMARANAALISTKKTRVSSGAEKCTTFRRRKVHHASAFEVVVRRSGGVA
jgi:hypothetical protein